MTLSAPIVASDAGPDGHGHANHHHGHDGHRHGDGRGHVSHDHAAAPSIATLRAPGLSLLRLSALHRLLGALLFSAILWAAVIWALQPL